MLMGDVARCRDLEGRVNNSYDNIFWPSTTAKLADLKLHFGCGCLLITNGLFQYINLWPELVVSYKIG